MTVQDISDSPSDPSAEEASLARIYRAAGNEQPTAAMDARIRAAAREAANTASARGRGVKRWAVPFAVAATVVLSVSVVLQMSQQGVMEEQEGTAFKRSNTPESVASPPAVAQKKPAAVSEPSSAMRRQIAPSELSKLKQDAAPAAPMRERVDKIEPMRDAGAPVPSKREEIAAAMATKRGPLADVIRAQVSGSPGGYYFSVTIRSPDKGCAQYADWWEVVSADGKLLYRRVLLHSHTDEQPFERSGGPVPIQPDTPIWVRAHMKNGGYGGVALKGSVESGFAAATPSSGFAADTAKQPPLPNGCAF